MNLCASLLCLLFLAGLGKNSAEFAVVHLFLQNLLPLWRERRSKGEKGPCNASYGKEFRWGSLGCRMKVAVSLSEGFCSAPLLGSKKQVCPGCELRRINTRFAAAQSLPSHVWHWELGTRAGCV